MLLFIMQIKKKYYITFLITINIVISNPIDDIKYNENLDLGRNNDPKLINDISKTKIFFNKRLWEFLTLPGLRNWTDFIYPESTISYFETNEKIVAFTIDDGFCGIDNVGGCMINEVKELFKKYDAKATFFTTGSHCKNANYNDVISLIEDSSIGEWVEGLIDAYPKPFKEKKIILTKEKLDIISGVDIDDLFIKTTLIQLGFKINSNSKGKWTCIPPSWRPDIEREVDVIEELIRFYGYDKVPSRYHYESIMNASDPDPHKYLDDVISIMAGLGFSQVFNNSLQSKNTVSLLDYDPVHIMNPLSDKMNRMRNSLLPGLLENIDFNLKNGHPDTMLFEWGNVFEQKSKGLKGIVEKLHLSAVIHGYLNKTSVHRNKARKCDFGVIRGLFSNLMQRLNVNNITFSNNDNSSFGFINSLSIHADNQKLGEIGKINPKFSKTMNLDNDDTYGFQLDLELLMSLAKNISTYNSIVTFPLIERDLNFIVDEQILAGELISSVKKNGTSLLKSAQPVNVFRHSSLGNNKKSITINMIFQSPTKTLEDKDVNPIIDKIIQVVSKKYSAKLR